MSRKHFLINFNEEERQTLRKVVRSGEEKARKITRCRILLLADGEYGKTDQEISDVLHVCRATVFNIRRRYCQAGLERALSETARSGQPPKLKGKVAAKITAIACSTPPEGQARWSLRLLADRVVELNLVASISHQSVRNILKKTNSSHTLRSSGVLER